MPEGYWRILDAAEELRAWLGQHLVAEVRWALLRPTKALCHTPLWSLARAGSYRPHVRARRRCWIPSPLGKSPLTLSPRVARPPAGALMLVSCCGTCGGAAFPAHVGGPLPWRWCHPRGFIACPSCNHTLHYRGQCRWNNGSRVAYVGPGTSNLCPDCWQHWARSVAGCPWRRRAPLQNDLLAHLLQAAEECHAGAGQSAALAASPSTPSQACATRPAARALCQRPS